MIIEITKENRHLVSLSTQAEILAFVLHDQDIMDQIKNAQIGAHILGCAIFEKLMNIEDKEFNVLVEYDLIKLPPPLIDGGIVGLTLSDQMMPDEFLDILNHWRELLRKNGQPGEIRPYRKTLKE